MSEEIKKLDEFIKATVERILAEKANDPEAQKKVQLQTKYAEAFSDALTSAGNRGSEIEKGVDNFGHFAMGILKGMNDPEKALSWAQKAHPENKFLHECFKALTVGTPTEGGFAVPEVLSADIIQYLYPKLAYAKLGARRIDMPNGNLSLPRFDAKSSATYIGETAKAADTKPTIGNVKGTAKKLAALIPVSNDLIRSSNPTFDAFVRDDLVMVLQLKKDYTAFYGPGTEYTPFGLDQLIVAANKLGSSATTFIADRVAELKGTLMAKDVPGISYGWAFSGYVWTWLYNLKTSTGQYIYRDEMNTGKLLGDPFVVSNQIYFSAAMAASDYADIWFGDFSELIEFVQLDMELVASKEASYVNSDGNTISALQNDMTVLRALCLHDFNIRHAVSFVKGTYKFSLT